MTEEYLKARKAGEKEYKAHLAAGEYPYLPALDDICPDADILSQRHLGIMEIPTGLIAGTKTRARQNSFAPGFMPLMEEDTEFAAKWSLLYQAQMDEGFNSPIKAYEYLHRFYVQEGNKRVSVSRYLDMPSIMADVTRLMPSAEVLAGDPSYTEFLEFYRVAPIYDIVCSESGAYAEIAEIMGMSIDEDAEPWPADVVKRLQTAFWNFCKAVRALQGKLPEMPLGDAFLVYLRIFTGDALASEPDREVEKKVRKIRKELYTAQNEDKVSLVETPEEALDAGGLIIKAGKLMSGPDSLMSKVIPAVTYNKRNPLKAAFIYDREPSESNWIHNHDEGRIDLEKTYGGIVETKVFMAVSKGDEDMKHYGSFDKAAEDAAAWGADVVFTPSVRQVNDTLRAAIKYEDIKFLNCSVNLAHQAVRTYYAKLYEAKFLAGIVAGQAAASDGTHMIGYYSDYPIYGTMASINAFAIGAAMADPGVRIYLDWASKQPEGWWWNMLDKGVHVLSVTDSIQNTDGSAAYGVCYVERCAPGRGNDATRSCRITNLAAPVYRWGKLYEIIVKTILDGTYNAQAMDKKTQATNYWWGMMSGAVDIELGSSLSPYTKQLVAILRRNIVDGLMNPFDGELKSHEGIVRHAEDKPLTSMDVITMDWLAENVIGDIPQAGELTPEGRETVRVTGISRAKRGIGRARGIRR